MNKIIFLDFDGVMDTARYDKVLTDKGLPKTDSYGVVFDPVCVENLRTIIERTGAGIVVTSSWKFFMSIDDLKDMWKARHLPGRIVGTTPIIDWSIHRGDEIDAWLDKHKEVSDYVILDDLPTDDFTEHQMKHLVSVDSYYGLNNEAAKIALNILNDNNC